MVGIRTSFVRNKVATGQPLAFDIEYDEGFRSTLITVERRKQNADGSFPTVSEWRWPLYVGDMPSLLFELVNNAPGSEGTYEYRTTLIDNGTGFTKATDNMLLTVSGAAAAATATNNIDFFTDPSFHPGAYGAMRVTYSANTFSNVILEWNAYTVLGNDVATNPLRTSRLNMDTWYEGDLQFVVPVPEDIGTYEWEWRLIDGNTSHVLASKRQVVHVLAVQIVPATPTPTETLPPVLPPVSAAPSAPSAGSPEPATVPPAGAGIPLDSVVMLLAIGVVVGLVTLGGASA